MSSRDGSGSFSRRRLLANLAIGSLAASRPGTASPVPVPSRGSPSGHRLPPVTAIVEDFSIGHLLRDGGRFPTPDTLRSCEVAIVGAGPSGLVAAYRLRDADIVVIEKEPVAGGNARSDIWHGESYAAGSHAFYANSPAAPLYDELGLVREALTLRRATVVDGEVIDDLWGTGLRRVMSSSAERGVRAACIAIDAIDVEGQRSELDRATFTDYLKPYGPGSVAWFDRVLRYFAADCASCSAYGGIQFVRALRGAGFGPLYPEREGRGGTWSFPGGLGAATLALSRRVDAAGAGRMVTSATVYSVVQDARGVEVRYLRGGEHVALRAKYAIVAAPKFIARRVVTGLPEDQYRAMGRMVYCPYVVGAVAIDGVLTTTLRAANVIGGPIASFIDASRSPDRQLLRFEMPLAPGDRPRLLEAGFSSSAAEAVTAYLSRLFPGARDRIAQVRIWLRGHNWYLPVPGMLSEFQSIGARPFGRVYFANADSVGPISDFGWAMVAADRAVDSIHGR